MLPDRLHSGNKTPRGEGSPCVCPEGSLNHSRQTTESLGVCYRSQRIRKSNLTAGQKRESYSLIMSFRHFNRNVRELVPSRRDSGNIYVTAVKRDVDVLSFFFQAN